MRQKRPLKILSEITVGNSLDIIIYEQPHGYTVDLYHHDRLDGHDFETESFNSKRKLKRFLSGIYLAQLNKILPKAGE